METIVHRKVAIRFLSFGAYLRGMETLETLTLSKKETRLEPTYEGWKHVVFHFLILLFRTVWSLPTRDGNPSFHKIPIKSVACLEPTYEGWKLVLDSSLRKHCPVWSLPTRDGNLFCGVAPPLFFNFVWSLPTRDGNFLTSCHKYWILSRLEPTYEGWKPLGLAHPLHCRNRLEPTYEGWKPTPLTPVPPLT